VGESVFSISTTQSIDRFVPPQNSPRFKTEVASVVVIKKKGDPNKFFFPLLVLSSICTLDNVETINMKFTIISIINSKSLSKLI
jgi:hypothetical protein